MPKQGWMSLVKDKVQSLEFVVPTVEQVRSCVAGYASGGHIPFNAKNIERVCMKQGGG
jgi:hypothetical protein